MTELLSSRKIHSSQSIYLFLLFSKSITALIKSIIMFKKRWFTILLFLLAISACKSPIKEDAHLLENLMLQVLPTVKYLTKYIQSTPP